MSKKAMQQDKKRAIVYQTKSGAIEVRADAGSETIWATQAQIAEVFGVERSVVTKHIRNLLKDSEVDQKSVAELISAFADTWLSLDAYDKDAFTAKGATKFGRSMNHTLTLL